MRSTMKTFPIKRCPPRGPISAGGVTFAQRRPPRNLPLSTDMCSKGLMARLRGLGSRKQGGSDPATHTTTTPGPSSCPARPQRSASTPASSDPATLGASQSTDGSTLPVLSVRPMQRSIASISTSPHPPASTSGVVMPNQATTVAQASSSSTTDIVTIAPAAQSTTRVTGTASARIVVLDSWSVNNPTFRLPPFPTAWEHAPFMESFAHRLRRHRRNKYRLAATMAAMEPSSFTRGEEAEAASMMGRWHRVP